MREIDIISAAGKVDLIIAAIISIGGIGDRPGGIGGEFDFSAGMVGLVFQIAIAVDLNGVSGESE